MTRIKQSVSWWCFVPQHFTPEAFVKTVADIGYPAVELVPSEHWQLAKDHGLTIASFSGHQSIQDGLNRTENGSRIEAELRASIAQAEKWNIPNVIVFSGNRNSQDDTTGAEITAENLRRVSKVAEDAGVNLVIELLNSKVDHPDYQCDSTAWGVKVCQMVDSTRVKLLYDIYHMQIMEGDVIRTIRDNHQYFGHYHTAGNPGRNEIDDTQELNYKPIMQAIVDTGYEGYVGQEFLPKGDPTTSLKQAFDICNVG
ncbi:MAG: TIM barrel protein [Anaerolineae bacterium]|nr:TIM barrel protein [Anaerolineae bacterium]